MQILVAGGTGMVGRDVVKGLLAGGERPRVLTRSPDKARALPAGAQGVVGDLSSPDTLSAALAGVSRLVLITAVSPAEADEGIAAVDAAQRAGVQRVVFLTVHHVDTIADAPHFASKIAIRERAQASGLEWTEIAPNNFFQNDAWFEQPLVQYGVYPQPIGTVGLHRVDTRDIAEALVTVTVEAGHAGRAYALVGPDRLTGEDTAAIWSRHLGKEIRYGGDDLDAWAAQVSQTMPAWLVDDLLIMFGAFQARGLLASAADHEATARLLSHPPRTFDDFARETAAAWRGGRTAHTP